MENLSLVVYALPSGIGIFETEVFRPGSQPGDLVFHGHIVPDSPESRAAAYRNAEAAIRQWKQKQVSVALLGLYQHLSLCLRNASRNSGAAGSVYDSPPLSGWVNCVIEYYRNLVNPPGRVSVVLDAAPQVALTLQHLDTLENWAQTLPKPAYFQEALAYCRVNVTASENTSA
jgi:hypothetical protein